MNLSPKETRDYGSWALGLGSVNPVILFPLAIDHAGDPADDSIFGSATTELAADDCLSNLLGRDTGIKRADQQPEPGYHSRDQVRHRQARGEIAERAVEGGGEEVGEREMERDQTTAVLEEYRLNPGQPNIAEPFPPDPRNRISVLQMDVVNEYLAGCRVRVQTATNS